MDEIGLPHRMFEVGFEPAGKKRINNYFNLRWIENIKPAIEDEYLEMLASSQFGQLMLMGNHTFSVRFVHYLLSRQLVTRKEYELWWVFAGKPIRYAIEDFAMVTGLNCDIPVLGSTKRGRKGKNKGKASGKEKGKGKEEVSSMWTMLFGKEEKPTTDWILDRLLLGKKYKDPITRFRLALLLLVDGILCPTCGETNIRRDIVEKLWDVDAFLKYPWGREAFVLTVKSAKARNVSQYAQSSTAIQGFAHAMVLVTACCYPALIATPECGDRLFDEEIPIEDVVQNVVERKLTINVTFARTLDQKGQVEVRSMLSEGVYGIDDALHFTKEQDDSEVTHLVALIAEDFPFEHNIWSGLYKAEDVAGKRGEKMVAGEDEGEEYEMEKGTKVKGGRDEDQNRSIPGPSMRTPPQQTHSTVDINVGIRRAADEFEERVMAMFEAYTRSMKDHITTTNSAMLKKIADMLTRTGQRSENLSSLPGETSHTGGESVGAGTGPRVAAKCAPHTHPDGDLGETMKHNNRRSGQTHIDSMVMSHDMDGFGMGRTELVDDRCDIAKEVSAEFREPKIDMENDRVACPTNFTNRVCDELMEIRRGADSRNESSNNGWRKSVSNPASQCVGGNVEIVPPRFSVGLPQMKFNAKSYSEAHAPMVDKQVAIQIRDKHDKIMVKELQPLKVVSPYVPGGMMGELESEATSAQTESLLDTDDIPISKLMSKKNLRRCSKTTQAVQPERNVRQCISTNINTCYGEGHSPTDVMAGSTKIVGAHLLEEVGSFVDGFIPFKPPSAQRMIAFVYHLTRTKQNNMEQGIVEDVNIFMDILEARTTVSASAVDTLVKFIQIRRDKSGPYRFDFLPSVFLSALKREYERFTATAYKEKFKLSTYLCMLFASRPIWVSELDYIYCPLQLEHTHWVGVIIDLKQREIFVADCNTQCVANPQLQDHIEPIAFMIAYLLHERFGPHHTNGQPLNPLPVSRLDLSILCEIPWLSTIAALVMLELHSVGNLLQVEHVQEENIRAAAENYAIEAFQAFNPVVFPK